MRDRQHAMFCVNSTPWGDFLNDFSLTEKAGTLDLNELEIGTASMGRPRHGTDIAFPGLRLFAKSKPLTTFEDTD